VEAKEEGNVGEKGWCAELLDKSRKWEIRNTSRKKFRGEEEVVPFMLQRCHGVNPQGRDFPTKGNNLNEAHGPTQLAKKREAQWTIEVKFSEMVVCPFG